ncbi:sigma-70 family RNA polymerase sigma factor [Cellulophaga sp. HaHaR_3_176]|uniref:RNA polymerase sigma factor n=1 Tax=Cellulophaga sp. HaHaR_3_176 TaxID=1942464 RepID=UPI001C1FD70B|nr:sigma-70 family RNA polymerase sigma factor [Cellulophaga sp. HaHaR_3_176]QWX85372.1 sigma-70 family RNA polymerase sigma factor [Cellulophaga sp. HaHaR_3_176]
MLDNKGETLWFLFLEGNANAFSSIFKMYYASLHSYGLKICGNTEVTEDSLQNFFIYLYENRNTIGKVNNIKAYLFVSFRRALFTHLKKERIFTELDSKNAIDTNFEFSHEELTIKHEFSIAQRNVVINILNTLSPREREVIYLKYYSSLNTSDISEAMDISYQSVSNTLQKAFSKLRKTIENDMLSSILKK